MAIVKASDLLQDFQLMADEKWKYIAGAHRKGAVDCSGAFYYAYELHGGYMYHGSNTMWRKYTTTKGKIGEIDLVPGMAVFKYRAWTASQSSHGWYDTDVGDVYHVGMYMGNGLVVEAKGTKYGVVTSKVETWHLAALLIDTEYDVNEGEAPIASPFESFIGIVAVNSGYLNLRSGPSTLKSSIAKVYNNDTLLVVAEHGAWYEIDYNGKTLYASKSYIKKPDQPPTWIIFKLTVTPNNADALKQLLDDNNYTYDIEESWNAA